VTFASSKVKLTGTTGEAGDFISIYDGNAWLGQTTTKSDGSWSFTGKAASNVVHSYGANATSPTGSEGHGEAKAILGTAASNTLIGSTGNDVIVGNGGNDVITGGLGADKLTGGPGAVTFRYTNTAESRADAADLITDFMHGADRIDFSAIAGINASGGIPTFQGYLTGSGNLSLRAHSVAVMEVGGSTQILVNTSNMAETVTQSDTHAVDMRISLLGVNLGITGTDFHHN
jgi:Ca2+-binding RTX toxin-like protein